MCIAPIVHYCNMEYVFRYLVFGNSLPVIYEPEHCLKEIFEAWLSRPQHYPEYDFFCRVIEKPVGYANRHKQALSRFELCNIFVILKSEITLNSDKLFGKLRMIMQWVAASRRKAYFEQRIFPARILRRLQYAGIFAIDRVMVYSLRAHQSQGKAHSINLSLSSLK